MTVHHAENHLGIKNKKKKKKKACFLRRLLENKPYQYTSNKNILAPAISESCRLNCQKSTETHRINHLYLPTKQSSTSNLFSRPFSSDLVQGGVWTTAVAGRSNRLHVARLTAGKMFVVVSPPILAKSKIIQPSNESAMAFD
jgi:hypothetical protein